MTYVYESRARTSVGGQAMGGADTGGNGRAGGKCIVLYERSIATLIIIIIKIQRRVAS